MEHPRILAAVLTFLTAALVRAEPPARTDRFADPLPEGAVARLGTLRFREPDTIVTSALSPDGTTLATVGWRRDLVRFLDAATGKELRVVQLDAPGVDDLTFSPNGAVLATRWAENVILWDALTGKRLREWETHKGDTAPNCSADGKVLAAAGGPRGTGGSVLVWDTATGEPLADLDTAPDRDGRVALSPDGKLLASWDAAAGVEVWDVKQGKILHRLPPPESRPSRASAVFAPDGKVLAVARGAGVELRDPGTGKELRTLDGLRRGASVVAFSPDGKFLAAADGAGECHLWDAATGKRLGSCASRTEIVPSFGFRADGSVVAWGERGRELCVWEVPGGKPVFGEVGHSCPVRLVGFLAGGKTVVSASGDGTLCLWDTATGKESRRLRPGVARGEPFQVKRFGGFALSADGDTVAAWGRADPVRVLDLGSGKPVRDLKEAGDRVYAIHFTPDGKGLATAGRGGLVVWDVATAKALLKKDFEATFVGGLAFSPDGRSVAVSHDDPDAERDAEWPPTVDGMRVLDAATGKERWRLKRTDLGPGMLAFSPDGRLLATTGNRHKLQLWDAATGKEAVTADRTPGPGQFVVPPAFAPDGRTVACAVFDEDSGDGRVTLWEVSTGAVRREFTGHRGAVSALAFAPDGKVLATGSADTTVLLWSLEGAGEALTDKEQAALWDDLGSSDGKEAYRALLRLAAAPRESVPLLRRHVQPVARGPDSAALLRLIGELDSDDFKVRERAQEALEQAGEAARPAAVEALASKPSAEMKRRLSALLERLDAPEVPPGMVRPLRALEVLERVGNPEARKLLEELARGRADSVLTREARGALERLDRPGP
jgi:WD40 repeat protein